MVVRIALDHNHWIALSEALHGKPSSSESAQVLELLRTGVKEGRYSLPLTLQRYDEIGHTSQAYRRRRLARTMLELARAPGIIAPDTLAAPGMVIRIELENAFHRRFGLPRNPPDLSTIYGYGIGHAVEDPHFLSDYLRHQGIRVTPAALYQLEELALIGPNADTLQGGNRTVEYSTKMDERRMLLEKLREWSAKVRDRRMFREALADLMMTTYHPVVNLAIAQARLSREEIRHFADRKFVYHLANELPSRLVENRLIEQWIRQGSVPPHRNDMNDIEFLSVSIPYCHAVVTEKLWADIYKQTSLGRLFPTGVFGRLTELYNHIVQSN